MVVETFATTDKCPRIYLFLKSTQSTTLMELQVHTPRGTLRWSCTNLSYKPMYSSNWLLERLPTGEGKSLPEIQPKSGTKGLCWLVQIWWRKRKRKRKGTNLRQSANHAVFWGEFKRRYKTVFAMYEKTGRIAKCDHCICSYALSLHSNALDTYAVRVTIPYLLALRKACPIRDLFHESFSIWLVETQNLDIIVWPSCGDRLFQTLISKLATSTEDGLEVIHESIVLDSIPELVDLLSWALFQGAILKSLRGWLHLGPFRSTENDSISQLWLQSTVIVDPSVCQFCLWDAFLVSNSLPVIQEAQEAFCLVHLVVDAEHLLARKSALLIFNKFSVFSLQLLTFYQLVNMIETYQETASDGAVRIKWYTILSQ